MHASVCTLLLIVAIAHNEDDDSAIKLDRQVRITSINQLNGPKGQKAKARPTRRESKGPISTIQGYPVPSNPILSTVPNLLYLTPTAYNLHRRLGQQAGEHVLSYTIPLLASWSERVYLTFTRPACRIAKRTRIDSPFLIIRVSNMVMLGMKMKRGPMSNPSLRLRHRPV
jgi:hypothetical protein